MTDDRAGDGVLTISAWAEIVGCEASIRARLTSHVRGKADPQISHAASVDEILEGVRQWLEYVVFAESE